MRLRSYFAGYVAATMLAAGSALAQETSGSKPHAGTDLGRQAPSGKSLDNYGWGGAGGIWYKRPRIVKPLPVQTNQCHHGIPYDFKLDPQRGVATRDFQNCQRDERVPQQTFDCRELDHEIGNLDEDIEHIKRELAKQPPAAEIDLFGMGRITTVPRNDAEEVLRAFEQNMTNATKALRKMQQDPHNRFGCTPSS